MKKQANIRSLEKRNSRRKGTLLEDSEDIESVLDGPLRELVDGVVRVRGVTNSVGTSDEGLEGNVGHKLSEGTLQGRRQDRMMKRC